MRKFTTLREGSATRNVFAVEKREGDGCVVRTSVVGKELYHYRVEIDFEAVAYMAQRAAYSKTGKCVDGPLRVIITKRRPI